MVGSEIGIRDRKMDRLQLLAGVARGRLVAAKHEEFNHPLKVRKWTGTDCCQTLGIQPSFEGEKMDRLQMLAGVARGRLVAAKHEEFHHPLKVI